MRANARRAGVDPSLVLQHYGSKDDRFATSRDDRAPVAGRGAAPATGDGRP